MLYFAYGSNMSWQQMKERRPSALFVGIALLPDHKLAFTRMSITWGCGVADAVRELGSRVWGVVYEVNDLDIGKLDKCEGYLPEREKNSYWRRESFVFLNGDDQRPLKVFVYFADPQQNPPPPNTEYKQLIVSGARHWHLPVEYVRDLEAIEVSG